MANRTWREVEEAFARFDRFRVMAPVLVAMRRIAIMIQRDDTFADVEPLVSHASLRLKRRSSTRDVSVSWHEGDEYTVSFVEPPLEFTERKRVRLDDVLHVLREYLDRSHL